MDILTRPSKAWIHICCLSSILNIRSVITNESNEEVRLGRLSVFYLLEEVIIAIFLFL